MIKLNDKVKIKEGIREGETAEVIYLDEDNSLCKVMFQDGEFYGYDINSVEKNEKYSLKEAVSFALEEYNADTILEICIYEKDGWQYKTSALNNADPVEVAKILYLRDY